MRGDGMPWVSQSTSLIKATRPTCGSKPLGAYRRLIKLRLEAAIFPEAPAAALGDICDGNDRHRSFGWRFRRYPTFWRQ
jgi:hypothetical protein